MTITFSATMSFTTGGILAADGHTYNGLGYRWSADYITNDVFNCFNNLATNSTLLGGPRYSLFDNGSGVAGFFTLPVPTVSMSASWPALRIVSA